MKKIALGAFLCLSVVLAACGFSEGEVEVRVASTLTAVAVVVPTETRIPLPTDTLVPTPTRKPVASQTPVSLTQTGVFVRAVDGDTIDVRFPDGSTERVRLIGMDTPERGDPCYKEATDAIAFFEGMEVTLEKDVSERDRYGRLLRFVYVGDLMLNDTQVMNGWAKVYTYPPDVKYAETFVDAQRIAQSNSFGLWGATCSPGASVPLPTQAGDASYPGTCSGPDLDCGNFSSQAQAQAFFEMCGGPNADPHRLDGDHDGSVCESLP